MTNLRAIREKRGYSQVKVAEAVGVSKQAYGKYELGKSEASYETLLKLAEFLETTVDEIIRGSDNAQYKMPDQPETDQNAAYKMPDAIACLAPAGQKNTIPIDTTMDGLTKAIRGLSEEDIKEVKQFIEFIKQKNHGQSSE